MEHIAPNRLRPVLISSMTMILLSITPFISFINLFFCSGIILGGVVGVLSLRKQLNNSVNLLNYKDSVMIGILSGILSSVIITGFNILILMYSKNNPFLEMKGFLDTFTDKFPEISSEIAKLSSEYDKYGFSPTLSIVMFIMHLFLYPFFGTIGALITVFILKKKNN